MAEYYGNTTYLRILNENMRVSYNQQSGCFKFSCFSDNTNAGTVYINLSEDKEYLYVVVGLQEPRHKLTYTEGLFLKHMHKFYSTVIQNEDLFLLLVEFLSCIVDSSVESIEKFPALYDQLTTWNKK